MKSNEEFKSEVYERAEVKQKQIRLQRRRIAVMVPCIAIVVLAAVVSFGFMDLPSVQVGDSADSAAPEAENQNDVNNVQAQDDFEIYTAEYETTAGNTAQKPDEQSDGATADGDDFDEAVAGTPPASSSNYLCIRMFFVEPKAKEPYVTAQVIDSPSELEAYFKENNCDGEDSFYDFYTNEAFDGRFFIAIDAKDYGYKGITQTDEAIEIRMELSENTDSNGKACIMMLPLFTKQYDKTKRIEIIKS